MWFYEQKLLRSTGWRMMTVRTTCLGWVTLSSLIAKQMSWSTGGWQLDEARGINTLLKPVFSRLCTSVPSARPNSNHYSSTVPQSLQLDLLLPPLWGSDRGSVQSTASGWSSWRLAAATIILWLNHHLNKEQGEFSPHFHFCGQSFLRGDDILKRQGRHHILTWGWCAILNPADLQVWTWITVSGSQGRVTRFEGKGSTEQVVSGRLAAGLMTKGLYTHVLSDCGRALLMDSKSPSPSLCLHLSAEEHRKQKQLC